MINMDQNKKLHLVCIRCGRKLRTEESQIVGMGKICREKAQNHNNRKSLFRSDTGAESSSRISEQKQSF